MIRSHTPQGSSVTSQVLCCLFFPSKRQKYLSLVKHGINMVWENMKFNLH